MIHRDIYVRSRYDTATAGFEVYYYSPVNRSMLTPIGRIQARAKTFADTHPLSERGVHITSTAILLDYFAGWEAPCAATDNGWPFTSGFGQTSYEAPDFLADGIFDLVWPGYRNAGFYHDASFEMAPTPWGDVADVLLSDVSAELLSRYDTVIVAHALQSNSLTVADRLDQFVVGGGQLTMMYDSLADLGMAGEKLVGNTSISGPGRLNNRGCPLYDSARVTFVDGSTVEEPNRQRFCALEPPNGAQVLATVVVRTGTEYSGVDAAAVPVAFRTQPNKRGGSVTVIGVGNYGVTPTVLPIDTPCQVDKPTASPQPLARSVARLLPNTMADQALFDIGGPNTSLSWVPKRVTDTEFIIGVSNTQLQEQALDIKSTFGRISSTTEILLDDSEKREAGYLPFGFQGHEIGRSTDTTIAGADFRMFRVTVQPDASAPKGINALPRAAMPTAPTGVWLRLTSSLELQQSLQRRVTFKQNFDGVLLDWSYLRIRTYQAVQTDAHWLHSQRLHAGVDLSSAINLFPGLRLGNFTSDPTGCHGDGLCADGEFFEQSLATIRDVLRKCSAMNNNRTSMPVCRDVFFTLHGMPELGPKPSEVKQQVAATIELLRAEAAAFAVPLTLHLRQTRKNADVAGATAQEQHAWAASVGTQFSPNTGLAALEGDNLHGLLSPGSFLLVDGVSNLYATRRVGTERTRLVDTGPQFLKAITALVHLASTSNASVVLDANYASLVDEEADSIWLTQVLRSQPQPSPPPPPPPSPSPSPQPGSRCFQLGTAQHGICSVIGNTTRHQHVVMGCPSARDSDCYADYMFANGTWARDYEHNFNGTLTTANVANATTQLTEKEGQWTITVIVGLNSEASNKAKGVSLASWQSATGYMQPQDVTSIVCGVPQARQIAFACVCGYRSC